MTPSGLEGLDLMRLDTARRRPMCGVNDALQRFRGLRQSDARRKDGDRPRDHGGR